METLQVTLEEKKSAFWKEYSKYKRMNNILLGVSVAVIIADYIWLLPINQILGFVVIGVMLAALLFYSSFMKKNISAKVNVYLKDFYTLTSQYAFESDRRDQFQSAMEEKLQTSDFVDARILKDIIHSGSRNLVSYDYRSFQVKVADYVAYREVNKKRTPVFLGKLFVVKAATTFSGRTVIYLKPAKETTVPNFGPDDVIDINKVVDNDKMVVYSSDERTPLADSKTLDVIQGLVPNQYLVDATFVFEGDKVTIALSYSDDLMAVPLKEEFNPLPLQTFKQNVGDIHQILNHLA